jgi:hypothetical protein
LQADIAGYFLTLSHWLVKEEAEKRRLLEVMRHPQREARRAAVTRRRASPTLQTTAVRLPSSSCLGVLGVGGSVAHRPGTQGAASLW